MAKGQKRPNKEAKKPKRPKAVPSASAIFEKGTPALGGTSKKT